MATALKNMHIQYTKININRDMASFARYETNGFEIQTKVTYVIPLKYKRASKKPSKTLHFNTRHQQLHLTF